MPMEKALAFARGNREKFLRDLNELLEIPSVSTLPQYKDDMTRAAEWLMFRLMALGFESRLLSTPGNPVVYGERMRAGPSAPVLLLYGHYDVQPAEPLEEWTTAPFTPSVRGENIHARGASDMKGPLIAYLGALESVLASEGLPVNVKILFEGEEEIGSVNLQPLLTSQKNLLQCDVVLNGDTMILRPDLPTIIYALRGLAYFEIRVETAQHDLHSGLFGGASPNAGQALCELVQGMHDAQGRVTLPGFYDDVLPMEDEERGELARVPYSEAEFLAQSTSYAAIGEVGFSIPERIGARPTLEVNGLLSGFVEEGSKTVLPARAMAKISMRLVPHQKAERVREQLEEYMRRQAPPWLKWEVINLVGGPAAMVRCDTMEMQAAVRALEGAFGVKPVFFREGGSVPVVSMFQDILGRESIMVGISLPDDNLHAPNEKLHLPTFFHGMEAYIRFFYELTR